MKNIQGHWLPDGDREKWLTKGGLDKRGWSMYQRDRFEAILKHCEPGRRRTFVDGGAHVGLYARPAGASFQIVKAFEPHPDTYACLLRNLADDHPNVHTYRLALAQHSGKLAMQHAKAGASMSTKTVNALTPTSFSAASVAIDELEFANVDAIKLDLEGGEFDALCGAVKTLIRCRPVVLIEEKHDLDRRASRMLLTLGMRLVWSAKNDRLFIWP